METFKVSNLTFKYPETDNCVLNNISFTVNSGDFITLCGPSGCGKSTLLQHLKPVLAPHGTKSGTILFNNKDINSLSHREQSQKIGYVFQSPDNQIVTDKVWHELAFGLESLGLENNIIRKRVAETASYFGIQNWFDKNVNELSGGQKQILNLASIMAMQPEAIILDEPTSQLDPIAASDFLACLSKINREIGTTIIITEHRLDEIISISNRVLVIEGGKVISYDTPKNTGRNLKKLNSKTFISLPAPMRIWDSVCGYDDDCPVTISEGREWLNNFSKNNKLYDLYPELIPKHSDKVAVEVKDVWFRYAKNSPDVIKGLSFKAFEGEFVAILGGNGTGKSTLLSLINSINTPYRGKVTLNNNINVASLPQNPQTLFLKKTVLEDLKEVFSGQKYSFEELNNRINSVIKLCNLEELVNRHPYDLSGGEQQRAALAKILLLRPKILLLDEPTKGIDAEFKIKFADIMQTLTNSGITVIMVSHDIEFCAKYAHRCVMLFNGEAVAQGTPREFFSSNSFYVTSSNRMSRGIIKNAVTPDDVIYCCTGKKPENSDTEKKIFLNDNLFNNNIKEKVTPTDNHLPLWKKVLGVLSSIALLIGILINFDVFDFCKSDSFPILLDYLVIWVPIILLMISFGSATNFKTERVSGNSTNRKVPKRTIAAAVVIFLTIPITIFIGLTYLKDEKYLFISLLVLLECMIPFFLVFEGRKPQARELVIIAVLCAIAVAGRYAFYVIPQFKPLLAVVIISGVAFGGETGFLVGATSMLVSNIFFGQGPWTPWQMFAAGIIGFIAGVLYKKKFLVQNRLSLCVFGFIATIVIYGGLMNFCTLVSSHSVINFETITAYFISGLPFDLIHGLSTFAFLYFGAEPMLEKLDRVKTKYGLIT